MFRGLVLVPDVLVLVLVAKIGETVSADDSSSGECSLLD